MKDFPTDPNKSNPTELEKQGGACFHAQKKQHKRVLLSLQ
jgi:hypothetical protein